MKVAVVTLGCRTNQAESDSLSCKIVENGHDLVGINDNPEVCIINSCTVTAKADAQSRQLISRALKRNAKVAITGCYAHLHKSIIVESFPDVHVIDNDGKNIFSSYLPILGKGCNILESPSMQRVLRRHRPVIKVQDGCDNSCSYCIIPKARGSSLSKAVTEVLHEAQRLEAQGFQEIVLSGIHLGMYGKDGQPPSSLKELLEVLKRNLIRPRIRLSSLEVNEIDDELLSIMQNKRICSHLHIPLQSGSDTVLERMNRLYRQADFEQCMLNANNRLKHLAIGTDVIIGFPGETEHEFQETCDFLQCMPFAYIHVFPYSVRVGTRAALMKGQINDHKKQQRVSEVKAIAAQKKRRFAQDQVGQVVDVLVERGCDAGYEGMSGNYCKVRIVSDKSYVLGMNVSAEVEGVDDEILVAHPIN